MKKFAYLLTLLLLIVGGNESAFAAVDWGLSASSLKSITANQTVVIKEAPNGLSGWSSNAYLNSGSSSVVSDVDYSCIYKFVENGTVNQGGNDYQVYVLYNLATGKYLAAENSYTENINDAFQMVPAHAETATADEINAFTEWTDYYNKTSLNPSTQPETLWTLCKKDGKQWLNFVGNPGVHSYHDTNIWLIYSVEESKIPAARLSVAQEAACAEVDVLAQLTTLFSVDAAAVKSSINAVSVVGDDVDAAVAQVNSIVRTAFNVNNKSIIFSNLKNDVRLNLHITAGTLDGSDVSKAYGTASIDKNKTVWTLKDNGNGTFKLYNAFSGLYLGTAASAGALSATASEGANFTFVIRGTNQVSLKDHAGNIFHQLNYWSPNYSYKDFNSDDVASNWKIESVTIADEEQIASYKATKASLLNLAYPYFQDKYGLVKDAAKMSVVVIETENTKDAQPVSNLLDGNTSTYVHSAYNNGGSDPHYIQVELSEAQRYIMFYMAKRNDGTNNNRPATIKVYVSSDGTDFGTAPVATLENLYYLGDPYYSPQIDLGGSYKYVRFVVSSTSSNTLFFTASEFYVLPINDETAVLSTQHDVTTINDVVLNLQNTLLAKAELYVPMNEAKALLSAHASNHAAVPALGQYTTTAYNALQTAVNNESVTLAEMEEALDAFDKAQNRPVFIFTSAHDGEYSNNSAIYDEGSSWKWKAKNYYDKSMFFTVKDLTATELTAGTAYNMYDYATGRSLFYDGTVTPEAVSGKEGVFNLKVNTGKGYLHCQNDGAALVTWYACAPNAEGTAYNNLASAWRIEYLGNSYDFDQKTDFPVSVNVNELMSIQQQLGGIIGNGLNQYTVTNNDEVQTAINAINELKNREEATRYSITNTEIRDAITVLESSLASATINQPTTKKLYRIKNLASGNYLTSEITSSRMTMNSANNTRESIFYLTEDNKLLSYKEGLFTQNFTSGNYGLQAAGSNGNAITFSRGNSITPCYHITCGSRSIYGKNATLDAGGNVDVDNTDNGYDWAIEEVQWLPVAVNSTAKYGTLYAPVDLSLRENLEAYTATVDGTKLKLQAVTDKIPAGTAVILKDNGAQRDEGTNCIYLQVTSGATPVSSNDLTGTYKTIAKPEQDIYTLQNPEEGIGFYKYTGTNLGGFKAYLSLASSQANGLSFDFGAATGLDNVATELPADAPAYDLTGRRVNKNTKGIIIVGNKKVINL